MAFGAVPVVRPVGGLRDTVIPYHDRPGDCTGFYIEKFSYDSLYNALKDVTEVYRKDSQLWQTIRTRCMEQDFSWENARENYYKLFAEIREELCPSQYLLS
jgi:starch synthase